MISVKKFNLSYMGPRRMENEDEEEDPFVYLNLTKVANYNRFQYYPAHSN
jgi:hypothetical protein